MNHTSGPWQVQITGGEVECVSGAGPGLWAVVQGPDYDTRAANARLIAAAPDLLEALEAIAEMTHNAAGGMHAEIYDAARAAIAKAKGE